MIKLSTPEHKTILHAQKRNLSFLLILGNFQTQKFIYIYICTYVKNCTSYEKSIISPLIWGLYLLNSYIRSKMVDITGHKVLVLILSKPCSDMQ